jgi:uncharacterized protein (TIRG00374 family)
MSASSSSSRLRWQAVVAAVLTLALVWWFAHSLDWSNVWEAMTDANVGLIVLTIAITFQTYVLRAMRWQLLLAPLGRARFGPAFRTTVIGFTATFLLPGRIGEVLRPYLMARESGFSAAAAFATIVVERVLDLATVILLFAAFLVVTPIDVGAEVKAGGLVAAIVCVAALGAMAASAGHPERLARWAGRLTRLLPDRAEAAIGNLVQTFVEGLAVMRRPGGLIGAAVLSVLLWLSIALGIWVTSRALDVTFAFSGSFLVVMFLVVGVAMPTPAGVGGFHAMYQLAVTRFLAAPPDRAAAAAIVLHALSFVPVSILGLAFMARDGLTLGGLRRLKSDAQAEERRPTET